MGRDREHRGHGSAARERIERAREHYETRAGRRPEQRWYVARPDGSARLIGPLDTKHYRDAVPVRS